MSFPPPPGPPPPRVPEGWKTQFHEGYQQWYYVNLSTGKSQWEPPEIPSEAPPSYDTLEQGNAASAPAAAAGTVSAEGKPTTVSTPTLGSNNPFNTKISKLSSSTAGDNGGLDTTVTSKDTVSSQIEEDARLAMQLQAEEEARAREYEERQRHSQEQSQSQSQAKSKGGNASHHDDSDQSCPALQQSQSQPQLDTRSQSQQSRKKGGILGRLASKLSHHHQSNRPHSSSGMTGYPLHHAYDAASTYNGQPSYYSSQPAMYGTRPPMGAGGAYYPYGQPYPATIYQRRHGGSGMGTAAGAAALGLGGGLLGGALLADAFDDHDYADGYQDGFADGGDWDF
ncbi:hypothetical protein VTO42DRAFT_4665 [Malbranchea cinnamomea]